MRALREVPASRVIAMENIEVHAGKGSTIYTFQRDEDPEWVDNIAADTLEAAWIELAKHETVYEFLKDLHKKAPTDTEATNYVQFYFRLRMSRKGEEAPIYYTAHGAVTKRKWSPPKEDDEE